MRILVTGCSGYLGSVLVPVLRSAGHDVVGLDSDLFERSAFGPALDGSSFVRGDVRDIGPGDVAGFDAIAHLGGISDDYTGALLPEQSLEINHAATMRFAKLAKDAGVSRFLFASSCSIYGNSGDDPVDEESAPAPVTPYGESKVRAEHDLRTTADTAFSPVFLRIATAYGVSPRLRLDLVLNNLVALAFTSGRVFIRGDGTPWRPLVHVEDVAGIFLAALEAPRERIHNQTFNVVTENHRVREIAEAVRQVVPGCVVEYAKNPSPDRRSCRVDFGKLARSLPDFSPRWDIRRGAQELYEAFQAQQLTAADLEGSKYNRIDTIKQLMETRRLGDNLRRTD
jgi:nucleoside-diphosphate-sugar epimerase